MARLLDVTRAMVDKDLHLARKAWRQQADDSCEELIAEQLQRIDLIETEAWAAWERSKENAETTIRDIENGVKTKAKVRKVSSDQYGDARFLAIALKCVDKRCRILGIGDYAEKVRGIPEDAMEQAMIVEVVVETREQAESMMSYERFQAISKPFEN